MKYFNKLKSTIFFLLYLSLKCKMITYYYNMIRYLTTPVKILFH